MGGRTIHWAITAHLQEHYGAFNAVYAHWLAADPSFDHYVMPDEPPRPGVTVLPLYETSSDVAAQVLEKYARSSWVAIVRVERSKVRSTAKSLGQLRRNSRKGTRSIYKKVGGRQVSAFLLSLIASMKSGAQRLGATG